MGALINTDGFKDQGITFPSGAMQNKLIREVYAKCGVNPAEVSYVEAHGTGTKVWSFILYTYDDFFNKNYKFRLVIHKKLIQLLNFSPKTELHHC